MIDYMKSGFDLLDQDERNKNNTLNNNANNKIINPVRNNKRDVEISAETYYEIKNKNTTDYSTETFESLEFAEDDVDMVKLVNNKKIDINKK